MVTKRAGTSTAAHVRSTTRKSSEIGASVRVWGEVSITVAVTEDPPQFIKVTFGHERIAPNDTEDTIARYERLIHRTNEGVVERRSEQLKRLIERVQG